jgi:hypothetical protein
MFDVYKRKFPEQPFPRRHVGSYETIDEVIEKTMLSVEEIIEAFVAVTESGYQIQQSYGFLGDGLDQYEIAEELGITQPTVAILLHRGIDKMKKNKKLEQLLSERTKRKAQSYEVVVSERISITV